MKNILNLVAAGTLVLFSVAAFSQKDSTIQIKTSGQCAECKDRIESNLAFEKGVKKVTFDIPTKVVTVIFKPAKTSAEKIRLAIAKLGYDADNVPADEKAYQKLPQCCQKEGH